MAESSVTRVAILDIDISHYLTLGLKDESQWSFYNNIWDGSRISRRWKPPVTYPIRTSRSDRRRTVGDLTFLGATIPVLSARAVDLMSDLLMGRAELLPIITNGEAYFAINVTNIVSALDHERSDMERFKSTGDVKWVKHYSFLREMIVDQPIFKIPEMRWSLTYVTDAFIDCVRLHNLTGFAFNDVWRSADEE